MPIPDLYANHIGTVLSIAPTSVGRFAKLADIKRISLYSDSPIVGEALSRWLFADFPTKTLVDEWGNRFDHQIHSLLAGSLQEGEELLATLESHGCTIIEAPDFFVPLQNVEINEITSSDAIRVRHPRAFALARRDRANLPELLTLLRDSSMLGS